MNKTKIAASVVGLALLGSASWAALPEFNPAAEAQPVMAALAQGAKSLADARAQGQASAPALPAGRQAPATPTVDKIFTGSSSWSEGNFQALGRLGVQKDAENDAALQCRNAGKLNCVVAGSQITYCKVYEKCEATATAIAIDVPNGMAPKVFKGDSSWGDGNYDSGYSALDRLGVRKDAEDRAVQSCREAGLLNCFATGSSIDFCNDYTCKADGTAIGF